MNRATFIPKKVHENANKNVADAPLEHCATGVDSRFIKEKQQKKQAATIPTAAVIKTRF